MADDNGNPYDPTLPAGPQGQSTDASKPPALKQMWDSWTSHPENNAAMINFGLQMMQPRDAGQSTLGQIGQAIGAGAEASQRNVATQRQQEQEDIATSLKEREEARRERETGYYGQIAARGGGMQSALNQQAKLRAAREQDFADWLNDKGGKYAAGDPRMDMIRQQFPKIKNKFELQDPKNADALRFAVQLHAQSFRPDPSLVGEGGGGGDDITQQAALQWARANPNDPRAKAVLQKAGQMGTGEE